MSSRNLEEYFKKLQKPSKSTGTCCIPHKVRAMEIILADTAFLWLIFESSSQTDLQALERAEIEGLAKKMVARKTSYAFSYVFRYFYTN